MSEDVGRYSRDSANQLLAEVTERLARLREASALLAAHRLTAAGAARTNGAALGGAAWLAASQVASQEVAWFEAAGIVIRDLEQGLVDFPAERDGKLIYLCWRVGEAAVDFWHGPETGFGGRQPL